MTDEEIKAERAKVYGDPLENHKGIAQMWAPLLQPHADTIKSGEPIPPHVVALLMCALKLDRMRLAFHEDNYADLRNYASFAEEWQKAEATKVDELSNSWDGKRYLLMSASGKRLGDYFDKKLAVSIASGALYGVVVMDMDCSPPSPVYANPKYIAGN